MVWLGYNWSTTRKVPAIYWWQLFVYLHRYMYSHICIHHPWLDELGHCPQMTELHMVIITAFWACRRDQSWPIVTMFDHATFCMYMLTLLTNMQPDKARHSQMQPSEDMHAWRAHLCLICGDASQKSMVCFYKIIFKMYFSHDHNMHAVIVWEASPLSIGCMPQQIGEVLRDYYRRAHSITPHDLVKGTGS